MLESVASWWFYGCCMPIARFVAAIVGALIAVGVPLAIVIYILAGIIRLSDWSDERLIRRRR